MFLSLLFKALKADVNLKRIAAMCKRSLQVREGTHASVVSVCETARRNVARVKRPFFLLARPARVRAGAASQFYKRFLMRSAAVHSLGQPHLLSPNGEWPPLLLFTLRNLSSISALVSPRFPRSHSLRKCPPSPSQVALAAPAPFACGTILLVSELLKQQPALWTSVLQPEDGEEDEKFVDAPLPEDFEMDAPEEEEAQPARGSGRATASAAGGGKIGGVKKGKGDEREDVEEGNDDGGKMSARFRFGERSSDDDEDGGAGPRPGGGDGTIVNGRGRIASAGYDMHKREPQFSKAERSCWWCACAFTPRLLLAPPTRFSVPINSVPEPTHLTLQSSAIHSTHACAFASLPLPSLFPVSLPGSSPPCRGTCTRPPPPWPALSSLAPTSCTRGTRSQTSTSRHSSTDGCRRRSRRARAPQALNLLSEDLSLASDRSLGGRRQGNSQRAVLLSGMSERTERVAT